MEIEVVHARITKEALKKIAAGQFGDFVKAVVDIERELVAIGGDLHADEEAKLMQLGSNQRHLWGINLYPDLPDSEWVEFDSMINVRPASGNRSRTVESPEIREKILGIVAKRIGD